MSLEIHFVRLVTQNLWYSCKIAKDITKDHELAMELWSTEEYLPRLLAILIMDNKLLSQEVLDQFNQDIQTHRFDERNNLMDWLMANQLTKDKKALVLLNSWESSPSALQRRAFWYYQGRLRWTGQTPPDNTAELLAKIEANIMHEELEVQWAGSVRERVCTKMKWSQEDVLQNIYRHLLRLKRVKDKLNSRKPPIESGADRRAIPE